MFRHLAKHVLVSCRLLTAMADAPQGRAPHGGVPTGSVGADEARAFVSLSPPLARPAPAQESAKVVVAPNRRMAPTMPRAMPPGVPPAGGALPFVAAPHAAAGMAYDPSAAYVATGDTPEHMPPVSTAAALPFAPRAASTHAGGATALPAQHHSRVAWGIGRARRRPPAQLASPGVLQPLATFLTALEPPPSTRASASGAPFASAAAAAFQPAAGICAPPESSNSPWTRALSVIPPANPPSANPGTQAPSYSHVAPLAPAPAASSAPPASSTEHPLASTNSPWHQTRVAAEALPSAAVELPSMTKPSSAAPLPPSPPSQAASRSAVTVLLGVVAIVLVGAIAALALKRRGGGDEPADINAGKQRDYNFDTAPTALPSATSAPKPVNLPRPPPKPKSTSDDPYADL